MENVTLQVLFRGISQTNIHFDGLKKKTCNANGRKIKVNSTEKYVKFLSNGCFFSSYISPLRLLKLLFSYSNTFLSHKLNLFMFYSCSQAKFFPRFLALPLLAGGNYPVPPNNDFWKSIFSQQKEGRILRPKK